MRKTLNDRRTFGKSELIVSVLLTLLTGTGQAQVWHSIAPMNFARTELCAITLSDGRVLVAGGNDGTTVLSSCEIYDPKTNTWTLTGSMNDPRYRFPMITIADGRIMVAGGLINMGVGTTNDVEIYDPKKGT